MPLPPSPHCHHRPSKQELSNKDQEKVAEVARVRVELQEQNGRLQAELTAQEALKEKAAALERQLKGECAWSPPHPPILGAWVDRELEVGEGTVGNGSALYSPSILHAVIMSDHREALLDRESENASLREKLRFKEAEMARIRDEEAQRASFLQNAVLTYVQGSPLRAPSPQK